MTNIERMTQLAQSFPTLRNVEGADPFDPEKLDATAGVLSHGGLYAARFVLAVWAGHSGRLKKVKQNKEEMYESTIESVWSCGPFDVVDAMGTWDDQHRAAFVAWAQNPWWAC